MTRCQDVAPANSYPKFLDGDDPAVQYLTALSAPHSSRVGHFHELSGCTAPPLLLVQWLWLHGPVLSIA